MIRWFFISLFHSPENFGDLAKIIFARLNTRAKKENTDFLAYIKKIDPQKTFYTDFILQSANFSLLNDMLLTKETLQDTLKELFVGLSKDEVVFYSIRLALFTEAVVNDKNFSLQKDFQVSLRQLYDKAGGINKYLIGSLLYLYRDKLNFLDQKDILEISRKNGISSNPELVPYDTIMKDGRISVHILFADKDAAGGHYGPTTDFFKQKGYQAISHQGNEITLKRGIVEIKLFKVDDGDYNIQSHIDQADIVISRSHAGKEQNVFRPEDNAVVSGDYRGKILFASACRSATVLPSILRPYKNAKGIGINTTGYGDMTNIVTYYLVEALQKRVSTFSGIKDSIRPHLEQEIKDYVFPGEPSTTLYEWLNNYDQGSNLSSSPIIRQVISSQAFHRQAVAGRFSEIEKSNNKLNDAGGIDLSQIELTLKDDKYISSLNPADIKILRAAKALKEEWNSLSLLYIHELMLLLLDDLASEIQNKNLLSQVLRQLQSQKFLDPQAVQFLNFIQSQRPLSEIKVSLLN